VDQWKRDRTAKEVKTLSETRPKAKRGTRKIMVQRLLVGLWCLLPLFSHASHLRTTSTHIHLTTSQLEQVGCTDECTNKAIKLIKDRIEVNVIMTKFVREVLKTLRVPRDEARIRTNLARDDLLGYVGNVWKAIAAGDVEAAVTQQTTILERLEFEDRLGSTLNATEEKGPNFVKSRGLVGGPVPNYRCPSGASLAGAEMPDGSNICVPIAGDLGNLPLKCAGFDLVANSVLKTLGDTDFKALCEKNPGCEYERFEDNANPGLCLPRSNHIDANGVPVVDDDRTIGIVGGLIADKECASGYARAGTFDPKRHKQHQCVDKDEVKKHPLSTQEAATALGKSQGKTLVGTVTQTEHPKTCSKRHAARLHGVSQVATAIRMKRIDCNQFSSTEAEDKAAEKKVCCDDPVPLTDKQRKMKKCQKELVKLIQRKESMDQDISSCALLLHNSKCDTISPERRCGKKPWCSSKQVDLMVRVAQGTDADCCSSYTCVAKGFSDGREKLAKGPAEHTTSTCPDFSGVSPLKSLIASGVGQKAIKAYKVVCVAVKGCVYIEESNTCV